MQMKLKFTPRSELLDYEWRRGGEAWRWPKVDRETMKQLLERDTFNGLWRSGLFFFCLAVSATATVIVSRHSLWLAIPVLYVYYFFYGFMVALAHELQHRTVFARSFDWFSERLFFFVQVLMWNCPTYARISHNLHHRYTMVRGTDPETDWPEVITYKWVRGMLWDLLLGILVVGAVRRLYNDVAKQVQRVRGIKDRMMRDHCTDEDIAAIRGESLAILLFHFAVVVAAIAFRRWEPIAFITLAWQIGTNIESIWHNTEHITRLYDVNDQRLATRSIRVSPLLRLIFWGLDDHIDHHMFPQVPSRNLPRLHKLLSKELPEPQNVFACWREILAISKEKDLRAQSEYVPCELTSSAQSTVKPRDQEAPGWQLTT